MMNDLFVCTMKKSMKKALEQLILDNKKSIYALFLQ